MTNYHDAINTIKNEKNRKTWLFLLIGACIFLLIKNYLLTAYPAIFGQASEPQTSAVVSIALLKSLPVLCVDSYILYYCAYKKPGTKLLTFGLIFIALSWICSIYNLLNGSINHFFNAYTTVLFGIDLALNIWWFILSLDLRRMNKAMQALHISEDNCRALALVREAQNQEDLEQKFFDAIRLSSSNFSTVLSQEYEAMKKKFLQ